MMKCFTLLPTLISIVAAGPRRSWKTWLGWSTVVSADATTKWELWTMSSAPASIPTSVASATPSLSNTVNSAARSYQSSSTAMATTTSLSPSAMASLWTFWSPPSTELSKGSPSSSFESVTTDEVSSAETLTKTSVSIGSVPVEESCTATSRTVSAPLTSVSTGTGTNIFWNSGERTSTALIVMDTSSSASTGVPSSLSSSSMIGPATDGLRGAPSNSRVETTYSGPAAATVQIVPTTTTTTSYARASSYNSSIPLATFGGGARRLRKSKHVVCFMLAAVVAAAAYL